MEYKIKLFKNKLIILLAGMIFFLFIGWIFGIISYYEIENRELWFLYLFLTTSLIIIIWKRIANGIRTLKDEDKIKIGKKLEFFFFITLFLSTYFLCFIIEKFDLWLMSILFSVSIISASYCGWLHFIEEINKPDSESGIQMTPKSSQKPYSYIITTIWIIALFLLFLFYLLQ